MTLPTLACVLFAALGADVPGGMAACQDTTAIDWFAPGSFDAARKKAEAEHRLLMIKGISFGVDEAGAACATKGCW
jgi:hypothetical protein